MSSYGSSREYGRGSSPEPPRKRVRGESPSYVELSDVLQSQHPLDTSDKKQIYPRGSAIPLMVDVDNEARRFSSNIDHSNRVPYFDDTRDLRHCSQSIFHQFDTLKTSSGINRNNVSSASESNFVRINEQSGYNPLLADRTRLGSNEMSNQFFIQRGVPNFSRSLDLNYGLNSNSVDSKIDNTSDYSVKPSTDTLEKEYNKFIEEFQNIDDDVNRDLSESNDSLNISERVDSNLNDFRQNQQDVISDSSKISPKKRLSGAQRRKILKLARLKRVSYQDMYHDRVTTCSNSGDKEWCQNLKLEIKMEKEKLKNIRIQKQQLKNLRIQKRLTKRLMKQNQDTKVDVQNLESKSFSQAELINKAPEPVSVQNQETESNLVTYPIGKFSHPERYLEKYRDSQMNNEGAVPTKNNPQSDLLDSHSKNSNNASFVVKMHDNRGLSKHVSFGREVVLTRNMEETLFQFTKLVSNLLSEKKLNINEQDLMQGTYRIKCSDKHTFNWLVFELNKLYKVYTEADLLLKSSTKHYESEIMLDISDINGNPLDLFLYLKQNSSLAEAGKDQRDQDKRDAIDVPRSFEQHNENAMEAKKFQSSDDAKIVPFHHSIDSSNAGIQHTGFRDATLEYKVTVSKRLSGAQRRRLRKLAKIKGSSPRDVYDLLFKKSEDFHDSKQGKDIQGGINYLPEKKYAYSRGSVSSQPESLFSGGPSLEKRNDNSYYYQRSKDIPLSPHTGSAPSRLPLNDSRSACYPRIEAIREGINPVTRHNIRECSTQRFNIFETGPSSVPEPDNIINVIIRDESQPLGRVLDKNVEILENALVDLLMKTLDTPDSKELSIRAVGLVKGNYKIKCFDEYSYKWLENSMNSLKTLWDGADLKLIRSFEHKMWKTTVTLPDKFLSPFEFLNELKEQNPLLQVGKWYLHHAQIIDSKQFLVFGIDPKSLDELEHLQFNPNYGSDKIKFSRPKGYCDDSNDAFRLWYTRAKNIANANE